jgi:hypothetical protein
MGFEPNAQQKRRCAGSPAHLVVLLCAVCHSLLCSAVSYGSQRCGRTGVRLQRLVHTDNTASIHSIGVKCRTRAVPRPLCVCVTSVLQALADNTPTATVRTSEVTSRFRRDIDEICGLLGCYAASGDNPLPTFRDNISVQSSRFNKSNEAASSDFLTPEDGTDMSRNVGKVLPIDTA